MNMQNEVNASWLAHNARIRALRWQRMRGHNREHVQAERERNARAQAGLFLRKMEKYVQRKKMEKNLLNFLFFAQNSEVPKKNDCVRKKKQRVHKPA